MTLVELLVATTLTLLLAALALTIATQVLGAWRRSNGRLLAQNQATLALDQVARDLECAVLQRDARVWLAATVQPDQTGEGEADAGAGGSRYLGEWTVPGVGKPGWSAPGTSGSSQRLAPASGDWRESRFGMAGIWLRLLTRPSDGSGTALQDFGAVRAVSYQIIRRRVSSSAAGAGVTAQRYALFRSEVRPFHGTASLAVRSVFGVGADLFAAPYNDPAATIPGSTEKGGSGDAEPGGLRRPDRSQVLAENVIDFGVRLQARDPAGAWRLLFPADAAGAPSENNRGFAATGAPRASVPGSAHPYAAAGEMRYGFPEAAEVLVRVLTEEGARQIEALEAGRAGARPAQFATDGEWWWGVALTHSEVFVRRVEIRSAAR